MSVEHDRWWMEYYTLNGSRLYLPDDLVLEQFWYGANYLIGTTMKPGSTAPGLWGAFIGNDRIKWNGDMTINYNHQAPFWGLTQANRIDLHRAHYPIFLQYQEQALLNAQQLNCTLDGCQHMPTHLAPFGFSGSVGHQGNLGMHFCQSFNALNMIDEYEYGVNDHYLSETLYPYLRAGMQWWMFYLQRQNLTSGEYRWVDPDDCTNEGCCCESHFNGAFPLMVIRRSVRAIVAYADYLQRDLDVVDEWRDRIDRLSAFPICNVTINGSVTQILALAEDNSTNAGRSTPVPRDNPLNVLPVIPGHAISIHSHPTMVMIAINSVRYMGFLNENSFPWMFPSAVRVGYPVSWFWQEWPVLMQMNFLPNLWYSQGGGGIETAGGMLAVQEMMLQSNEYALNLFPVWPANHSAAFDKLRAVGGFIVSGSYDGKLQRIGNVTIMSESGRRCAMFDPYQFSQDEKEQRSLSRFDEAQHLSVSQSQVNAIPFARGPHNIFPATAPLKGELRPAQKKDVIVLQTFDDGRPPQPVTIVWHSGPPPWFRILSH